MDLSATVAPKSDQLNADDLISGPRTITVTRVEAAQPDQPVSIFFEGDDGRPYKPCKSMRRVLLLVWGKDGAKYVGRALTIYRDPDVVFGGARVGGIRISHMSDIDEPKTMALTATRAQRKPYTVKPLEIARRAQPQNDMPSPDMNGPLLKLADSKGKVHEVGGDKWSRTLAGWFEKLPFDTAAALYRDNYEHLEWARLNGFEELHDHVRAVWLKRQEAAAETP